MEKIHFKNGLPYAGEASKVIRPIHMIIIMTMMNWWAWSKPKCCEYFQVGKNALLSRFHFAPAVTLIVCHKYWAHITPHLPLPMVACTPKNYCHLCIIHCISKRDTDYCLPVDLALQLVPRPPHTGGAERQRAAWAPLQLQHWYQALHTNLMLYTFDLDLEGVCFSWILTIFFSLFGPTTMGSSKNRSSPFCWYSKLFLYTRQHCFGRVNQILLDCNISFWVRTITPP